MDWLPSTRITNGNPAHQPYDADPGDDALTLSPSEGSLFMGMSESGPLMGSDFSFSLSMQPGFAKTQPSRFQSCAFQALFNLYLPIRSRKTTRYSQVPAAERDPAQTVVGKKNGGACFGVPPKSHRYGHRWFLFPDPEVIIRENEGEFWYFFHVLTLENESSSLSIKNLRKKSPVYRK